MTPRQLEAMIWFLLSLWLLGAFVAWELWRAMRFVAQRIKSLTEYVDAAHLRVQCLEKVVEQALDGQSGPPSMKPTRLKAPPPAGGES